MKTIIVGAGIHGCVLALELARLGVAVNLIEFGGMNAEIDPDFMEFPLKKGIQNQTAVNENDWGERHRLVGFGGSGNHWGGACLSFSRSEYTENFQYLSWEDYQRYIPRAKFYFGISGENDETLNQPNTERPQLVSREIENSNFTAGDMFSVMLERILKHPNITILPNRCMTNVTYSPIKKNEIENIIVHNRENNSKEFHSADNYVLCTGAVETARTILNIASIYPQIFGNKQNLKTYLPCGDHLGLWGYGALFPEGKLKTNTLYELKSSKLNVAIGVRFSEPLWGINSQTTSLIGKYTKYKQNQNIKLKPYRMELLIDCPPETGKITLKERKCNAGIKKAVLERDLGFVYNSLDEVLRLISEALELQAGGIIVSDKKEPEFDDFGFEAYHPFGTFAKNRDVDKNIIMNDFSLLGASNLFLTGTSLLGTGGVTTITYKSMPNTIYLADQLTN